MLSISCAGFVTTNLFQGTQTLTSVPVASSSSARMQRDGRSLDQIVRLGGRRVVHARAGCALCLFCWTGLTGSCGGVRVGRSDRLCRGRTLVLLQVLFRLKLATCCKDCKLFNLCKLCNLYVYLNYVCKNSCISVCHPFIFSSICRVCTICARLHVGLPVLFRSGRGLGKDRQIKPLS